jgi:hypothetical protein
MQGLNLVIPEKADPERDGVARAWAGAGGAVTRLGRFWDPPPLEAANVRLYANDTFALVLAQKLGLELVSPPDDLLARLPVALLHREVRMRLLQEAEALAYPAFVKSAVPKLFAAKVYAGGGELLAQARGLAPETQMLVSEIVSFSCEARCFMLGDTVLDVAAYEGQADLAGARELAARVAASGLLPETCVVDVGLIPGRGWAVVEANAAWGAGLNGCAAEKVLPCIAAATRRLPGTSTGTSTTAAGL